MELIIQGVFRSGTTIVFQCLRRDPRARSFYEPLHPQLPEMVQAARKGASRPLKNELFREYVPLEDEVLERFDRSFGYDDAVLGAGDEHPELEAYLRALDEPAERTNLQFNRAFWMIPWLAQAFPEAKLLHVVRDPRSVMYSQMRRRPEHESVVLEGGRHNGDPGAVFEEGADYSYYYTDRYLRVGDKAQRLDDDPAAPPYVRWLRLWEAQVGACHRDGHQALGDRYMSTTYEAFARHPGKVLGDLYDALDRPCPPEVSRFAKETVHPPRPKPWEKDPALARRFEQAIEQAGIQDTMDTFRYEP